MTHTCDDRRAEMSQVGSRAFPVAGQKTWNALPEDVTSSQSEYTFHRQLRSLFRTSSSDTDCILTSSLGLSVPTLRRFCHLRSTIWYDMIFDTDYCVVSLVYRKKDMLSWLNVVSALITTCPS